MWTSSPSSSGTFSSVPKGNPPWTGYSPSLVFQDLGSVGLLSVSAVLPIQDLSYQWNHEVCVLLRLVRVSASFLFMAEQYSTEWIYLPLFLHSRIGGHWCFQQPECFVNREVRLCCSHPPSSHPSHRFPLHLGPNSKCLLRPWWSCFLWTLPSLQTPPLSARHWLPYSSLHTPEPPPPWGLLDWHTLPQILAWCALSLILLSATQPLHVKLHSPVLYST